jgi:large repetitive protein
MARTLTRAPTVAITYKWLRNDTGPSATDGITTDGTVAFSGTVTGSTGTIVKIYDGTTLLGTAVLDGRGGWSFGTVLPVGVHSLRAVAVDPTGRTANSTTQWPLTIEPAVALPTISVISQLLATDSGLSTTDRVTNNGAVTLSGTVSGATGTVVRILDGTTVLGLARTRCKRWPWIRPAKRFRQPLSPQSRSTIRCRR